MEDTSSITNSKINNNDNVSIYSQKTNLTGKTGKTKKSVQSTKTAITSITYATEMLGNLEDLSFILLDLRDNQEYYNYHIKEAISFPSTNILRDKYPNEMYTFVSLAS